MGCVASKEAQCEDIPTLKPKEVIRTDSANTKARQLDSAPSKNSQFSDDSAEISMVSCKHCCIDDNVHALKPKDEAARLAAVRALGIIGTPPDARFDSLTNLAKTLFQTPIAALTLIEDDLIHIHSCAGEFPLKAAPRKGSFCNWLLLSKQPEMLIVEDGLKDARFAFNGHPAAPPNARFYAGAPLVGAGGHLYGSLCVLDPSPRQYKPEQYCLLGHLAQMAVVELERDLKSISQRSSIEVQSQSSTRITPTTTHIPPSTDGVVLCDVSRPQWPVVYTNKAWTDVTGESAGHEAYSAGEALFWQQFRDRVADPQDIHKALTTAKNGEPFTLKLVPKHVERQLIRAASSRMAGVGGMARSGSIGLGGAGPTGRSISMPVRSNANSLAAAAAAAVAATDNARNNNSGNVTSTTMSRLDSCKQDEELFKEEAIDVWFVPVGRQSKELGTEMLSLATKSHLSLPAGLYMDAESEIQCEDISGVPPREERDASCTSPTTCLMNSTTTTSDCGGVGGGGFDAEQSAALADALSALSGVRISNSVRSSGVSYSEHGSGSCGRGSTAGLASSTGGLSSSATADNNNLGSVLKAATSIIQLVSNPSEDHVDKLAPIYYIGIITPHRTSTKSSKGLIPMEEMPLEDLVPGDDSPRDSAGSMVLRDIDTVSDLDDFAAALHGPSLDDNDIFGGCVIASGQDLSSEVTLGPLIGSQSGAWRFRGHWKGAKVAVSVLERWAAGAPTTDETTIDAAAASLTHPHIVQTLAHSVKDSRAGNGNPSASSGGGLIYRQVWLVQEFCAKGSLLDGLEKGSLKRPDGSPNMVGILSTAHEIASAMQYVHNKGLAHPYLSSSNVVLASSSSSQFDGRGWIAKVTSTQWDAVDPTSPVAAAMAAGANGGVVQTAESRKSGDVLAFGVVLWEMLAGRRAYLGSEEFYRKSEMMGLHLEAPKDTPLGVAELLEACLASVASDRPTFDVIVGQIEALMHRNKLAAPLSRVVE